MQDILDGRPLNQDVYCARKERDERDCRLLAAAKAGSSAAFGDLYSLYEKSLFRLSYSITRHWQDAEDAVQDTFMRAYAALEEFRGEAQFSSWIHRIAVNSSLMLLRRRGRRREMSFEEPLDMDDHTLAYDFSDGRPDPEQTFVQNRGYHDLLRTIERLPQSLRIVLKQRAYGASVDEIGKKLGLSEAAIKARSHRARLRLSARLSAQSRPSLTSQDA
jgi:RNA polymerase sigma-70 factor, ECF subfamily